MPQDNIGAGQNVYEMCPACHPPFFFLSLGFSRFFYIYDQDLAGEISRPAVLPINMVAGHLIAD
jgi:hypothetical protein